MDVDEFKQFMREIMSEYMPSTKSSERKKPAPKNGRRKKELTLTHKLMYIATMVYFTTWVVGIVSWFMYREVPAELLKYGTFLYGVALSVYAGKSAYEYSKKYDPNYEEQDGV